MDLHDIKYYGNFENPDKFLKHFNNHDIEWCLINYPHMINEIMELVKLARRSIQKNYTKTWYPTKKEFLLFIKYGYDININDVILDNDYKITNTLLNMCEYRMNDMMEFLLNNGANKNIRDNEMRGAFDHVLLSDGEYVTKEEQEEDLKDCEECIKLLIKYDVNEIITKDTLDTIDIFCKHYKNSNIIKQLIDRSTIIN